MSQTSKVLEKVGGDVNSNNFQAPIFITLLDNA